MKRGRVWAFGLVLAIVATGIAYHQFPGLWASVAPADSTEAPMEDYRIAVKTIRVGSIKAPKTFSRLSGIVQARRESQLGFRRGGRVASIDVSEGDTAIADTVIAQLDTSDLVADRNRMQAEVRAATARLQELRNGPRPQTIAAARADVTRLEALVEGAQTRYDRQVQLRAQNVGVEQELDDARSSLAQAIASLGAASERLSELDEGTRQEKMDAAEADLAVIKARIARVDVDLQDSKILAPYDGAVALRLIDEGTIVTAGQPVFEFLETGRLEVRFGLPVEWTSKLSVGRTLPVELSSERGEQPSVAESRIVRIHPRVDSVTRSRPVDVELPTGSRAVIGQVVVLRLPVPESDRSGYWIPTTSLAKGTRGLWSVYAVSADELIERRDVRIHRTTGELSLVSGMIEPGDPIVSEGVHRVSPGIAVLELPSGTTSDSAPIQTASAP